VRGASTPALFYAGLLGPEPRGIFRWSGDRPRLSAQNSRPSARYWANRQRRFCSEKGGKMRRKPRRRV